MPFDGHDDDDYVEDMLRTETEQARELSGRAEGGFSEEGEDGDNDDELFLRRKRKARGTGKIGRAHV